MSGEVAKDNIHEDAGIADAVDGLDEWRAILTRYAAQIWSSADPNVQAGSNGSAANALLAADRKTLDEALGPMTEDSLRITRSFTLGTKASERTAAGRSLDKPPTGFFARLNIVLNGLEPAANVVLAEQAAPQIIQSELWQLLFKIRESADLAYARELDLIELDRRILLLLHNVGPLVPADIAGAVGMDKAQVSRSVKRLLELKIVERKQLRAPITLTRKGSVLSERLTRLAGLRNRELTFDVGDDELAHFFNIVEALLDRAVQLYERERRISQTSDRTFGRFRLEMTDDTGSTESVMIDRTRIVAPLMTLSSYFSRSGSLTFKRLTGLSNFEVWVLNEISMDPPIEWNRLMARLDRDHSQAGRTIKALLAKDLITREGKLGRRHGRFSPTKEGRKLYDIIQQASQQRSAYLLAPLSPSDRDQFLGTFETIRRNAAFQLERERALEELNG